jgi:hypothetical protein
MQSHEKSQSAAISMEYPHHYSMGGYIYSNDPHLPIYVPWSSPINHEKESPPPTMGYSHETACRNSVPYILQSRMPSHGTVMSYPIVYPNGASYYPPPPPLWGSPLPTLPVEYIRDIHPTDVLCGRGGATNSHSGNRSFRDLVKEYQSRYLFAKKRDKPDVAAEVVELIRKRGGRFLRRLEPFAGGEVLWLDIGDERAREKTCQALREGAPELKRRQDEETREGRRRSKQQRRGRPTTQAASPCRRRSHDGNRQRRSNSMESSCTSISTSSSITLSFQGSNEDDWEKTIVRKDPMVQETCETQKIPIPIVTIPSESLQSIHDCSVAEDDAWDTSTSLQPQEPVLMIRPCPQLMQRSVSDIVVSKMTFREQELYRNSFYPPQGEVINISSPPNKLTRIFPKDDTLSLCDSPPSPLLDLNWNDMKDFWEV